VSTAGPVARVTAAFGRHYLVETADGTAREATRRGKRGDVVVGDEVVLRTGTNAHPVIESLRPRRSVLMRADGAREKTLAANIDQVAVVFAAQPAFNIEFLWRALLAARCAGVEGLLILNKADLPDLAAARKTLDRMRSLGHEGLALSAKHGSQEAAATLQPHLAGRHTLLVGQSGMGKSTLLNLLVPQARARTQEFSTRLNLGKQTTSATRWYHLPGGGAIVDSPGFQSFGLGHLDETSIAAAMPEFAPLLGGCRFTDCRHLDEPDCAVRKAVADARIDAARYDFYRRLIEGRNR
jgi:ribosome biogenesis GTPase